MDWHNLDPRTEQQQQPPVQTQAAPKGSLLHAVTHMEPSVLTPTCVKKQLKTFYKLGQNGVPNVLIKLSDILKGTNGNVERTGLPAGSYCPALLSSKQSLCCKGYGVSIVDKVSSCCLFCRFRFK